MFITIIFPLSSGVFMITSIQSSKRMCALFLAVHMYVYAYIHEQDALFKFGSFIGCS